MSAHHFPAVTGGGEPVRVRCGYDRPLRGFYLTLERTEPEGEEESYVYSNLDDPRSDDLGMLSLDALLTRLGEHGIRAPAGLRAELEDDRRA